MKNYAKHLISVVGFAAFALIAAGSDEGAESASAKMQPAAYTMDAREFSQQYEENLIAAKEKYEGKVVVVNGMVVDISDRYIQIMSYGMSMPLYCFFDSSENGSMAKLSKGDYVSVKGFAKSSSSGGHLTGSSLVE